MAYCTNCGEASEIAANFCSQCGFRFSQNASVSPALSTTEPPAASFCSECGKPRELDASFCTHCGFRFRCPNPDCRRSRELTTYFCAHCGFRFSCPNLACSQISKPGDSFCDSCRCPLTTPVFPDALPLSRKKVKLGYSLVRIDRFVRNVGSMNYTVPWMLVTDKSILFLDNFRGNSYPFFIKKVSTTRVGRRMQWDLSPFWVLDSSLNGDLYEEFKKNPSAYSRALTLFGRYRSWIRVSSPVILGTESGLVHFPCLVQITSESVSGSLSGEKLEGNAQLFVNSHRGAAALEKHINKIVRVSVQCQ